MKLFLFLLLLASPVSIGFAAIPCKQIRVAVIDSGLDLNDPRFKGYLCPTGHKNFVEDETIADINNHGTHIAGIIKQMAGNSNYCLLIYKYYKDSAQGSVNSKNEIDSIAAAIDNGADIVNISGGGETFKETEYLLIKNNPTVTFIVAAGNDNLDLDKPENEYYPASYFLPNEEVVGSIDIHNEKSTFSNYGKLVKNKERGEWVYSYLPNTKYGLMSGTSQATAIFTGKFIQKLTNSCKGN